MLEKKVLYSHVLLIGSNSDIGRAILRIIPISESAELTLIGRDAVESNHSSARFTKNNFFRHDLMDSSNLEELDNFIHSLLNIDLVIVASATLPDENEETNFNSVFRTFETNSTGIATVMSMIIYKLRFQKCGDLLYISSVAAMRPRLRNFTYGASKIGSEFYVMGLAEKYRKQGLNIKILRPGYVFTKMSANFKPAPFSISLETAASRALECLSRRSTVAYAPRILKIVMPLAQLLPRYIFNRIN